MPRCRPPCRCRDFQARPDGTCYCTHSQIVHGTSSVEIPARGGNPDSDCSSFSRASAFEGHDFSVEQLCICGTSWLEHLAPSVHFSAPTQIATQAPVTPWLPPNLSQRPLPSGQALPNFPSSTLAAWTPGPTPSSSGLGQTSSLTGTRSMGITSGVFPSLFSQASNPSRHVNTQRGSARHRPYTGTSPGPFLSTNIPAGPRQFLLAFIPYAPEAAFNIDDIDNPEMRLYRETVHTFFERLGNHNLLRTITLQPTNIREQIHSHICTIMTENRLSIPNYTFSPNLAPNQEAFWGILQGGNRTKRGQLIKPADILPPDLVNFTKLDQVTPKLRSPLSALPVILVSAKSRVNGPIVPGSSEDHPCYASRVFWGVFSPPLDSEGSPHCFQDQCPVGSLFLPSTASIPSTPVSSTSSLPSPTPSFSALPVSSASPARSFSALPVSSPSPARSFSALPSLSAINSSNTVMIAPSTPVIQSILDSSSRRSSISLLDNDDHPHTIPRLPPRTLSPSPTFIDDSRQLRLRRTSHRRSILTTASSSDNNEIASPDTWLLRLRQLLDAPRDMMGLTIHVRERVLDPELVAAQTLLDALLSYHQGIAPPENSATICLLNYTELAIGEKAAHIGASVGAGPVRAVYERTLTLFTNDSSIWKPSQNNTFIWNVRAIPTNSLRLAKARTAGTLLALGYTWFARSFHPISFWLSAFCVTLSFDDLKSVDYISRIDEELADSLRAWPTDPDMPLISSSSLNTLLANYLNATYFELRDCWPDELIHYRDELFAQALFQTSAHSVRTDQELQAMKEAFDITLTPNIRLREMFGPSPLTLLRTMYGQLLQSAETLIEHLEFQPLSDSESRFTEDDFHAFQIKFARYLRGAGHPPNLPENVLPFSMRTAMANNESYRARRFLKCSTGSSTVPTNSDWKISIVLIDQVPDEYQVQQPVGADATWQAEIPAFIFHTCSHDVQVCYSPNLKEYLEMIDPYSDREPTPFDSWVHQHLIESQGGDGWNII